MNEEIKINEEAYRRGFAHGYQVGIETKPEKMSEIKNKIEEWRYDKKNMSGAPGTSFENHEMYKYYNAKQESKTTINKALFHLGNDVVKVSQKIDKNYDIGSTSQTICVHECLKEILRIVNVIRLEVLHSENEKTEWTLKVKCTDEERLGLYQKLQEMEVEYTLSKLL